MMSQVSYYPNKRSCVIANRSCRFTNIAMSGVIEWETLHMSSIPFCYRVVVGRLWKALETDRGTQLPFPCQNLYHGRFPGVEPTFGYVSYQGSLMLDLQGIQVAQDDL